MADLERGKVIDGDLVHRAITNACPEVLSDQACDQTADWALAYLASLDGVTVLRGEHSTPWKPDDANLAPMAKATGATSVGTARLIALLAARDRTLTALRKELEHVKRELERVNTDRQRLAQANENLRSDVALTAEQRDQWIARHVRAGDALTRICGQLREIADEHAPADDEPRRPDPTWPFRAAMGLTTRES